MDFSLLLAFIQESFFVKAAIIKRHEIDFYVAAIGHLIAKIQAIEGRIPKGIIKEGIIAVIGKLDIRLRHIDH